MTPGQIKTQYEKLRAKLTEARLVFEEKQGIIRARMKALQSRCKHPNGYPYTAMGDPGWRCPDCGYDR